MVRMTIQGEIIERISRLDEQRQQQVLEFARNLESGEFDYDAWFAAM